MLDSATAISIQTQINNSNYINLVSFVILYYDYFLTLPAEVERFWSSKSISWASSLFYINRYLAVLGHIPVMVQSYWGSNHARTAQVHVRSLSISPPKTRTELYIVPFRCPALASYHQYLAVVIQVIVGFLLIMRTYALYDRNIRVLLFICACGLVVIVYGTWTVVAGGGSTEESDLPNVGCVPPTTRADAKRFASAWTGMLLFDVLIFSMTLYKSLSRSRGGNRTLLNILLRDGAIYFGIMAFASLANILTFHLSPEYLRGFVTTFANIISSTMMSRLMLNLRDPKLTVRYFGHRVARDTATPSTNYPVLSTVLEFNTFSDASTTVDSHHR